MASEVKVAADFLALSIADVHLGLGQSSFLGNAAAAGLSAIPAKSGGAVPSAGVDGTCQRQVFTERELETLKQQLQKPRKGARGSMTHVEL